MERYIAPGLSPVAFLEILTHRKRNKAWKCKFTAATDKCRRFIQLKNGVHSAANFLVILRRGCIVRFGMPTHENFQPDSRYPNSQLIPDLPYIVTDLPSICLDGMPSLMEMKEPYGSWTWQMQWINAENYRLKWTEVLLHKTCNDSLICIQVKPRSLYWDKHASQPCNCGPGRCSFKGCYGRVWWVVIFSSTESMSHHTAIWWVTEYWN